MQNTMTKVVAGCAALSAIAFTGFLTPKQASAAVPTPRVHQNLTTGVFDWDDHHQGDRDDRRWQNRDRDDHRRNDRDRDDRRFYHRDGDDRHWRDRDRDDRWRDDRRILHERDWRWHRDHDHDDRGWR